MISEMVKRVRFDIYRALGQSMVKATDIVTGAVGIGTGFSDEEAKAKALIRMRADQPTEGAVQ